MTLAHIATFLSHYGYLPLFLISIVEGPIIIIIGGFLASVGVFNVYLVYAIAVLGDVIGDALYYAIGWKGRDSFIPKYGKYIGVTEARLQKAQTHYDKHLLRTILISKLSQVAITTMIVLAGATKTSFKKFMTIIIFVSLLKGFIFTVIGYYFGSSYQLIGKYLNDYIIAGTVLLVIGIAGYLTYKRSLYE